MMYSNLGADEVGVANPGGSTLEGLIVSNKNALVAHWFQIHDKAANPGANDVPVLSILVPPVSTVVVGDALARMSLANGLAWAWSTTQADLTASTAAADHTTHIAWS